MKTFKYIAIFTFLILAPILIGISELIKVITDNEYAQILVLIPAYFLIQMFIKYYNKKAVNK